MIIFTLRINCSDLLFKSVAVLTALFMVYLLVLGEISVFSGQSFNIELPGMSLDARTFLLQYGFIIPFLGILGFSKTFIEILQYSPLILSKSISRIELILKNTLGVFILSIVYTVCVVVALCALFLIKGGAIPFNFISSLFFLPVGILALYGMIISTSVFFESYAITVFTTFIYTGVQPILLSPQMAQMTFGIENPLYLRLFDSLLFLLPNIYGGINLMGEYLRGTFTVFGVLEILLSLIPIFLVAIIMMKRKNF